ncbi:MAG TPA: hypothetical protein DEO40_00470 [Treponema sp.]|nr:hypothetical protein [Treponema sp.]
MGDFKGHKSNPFCSRNVLRKHPLVWFSFFLGGTMKKNLRKAFLYTILAFSLASSYAGDAAVFSDIGFSEDGRTYIFGQYGKTDKKYEAWAEIYTVDVEKNTYVPGEVFRTKPSAATTKISGKTAFEELSKKTLWKRRPYKCTPCKPQNLLYVRETESKKSTDEIVFKDFEGSNETKEIFYCLRLVPTYHGSGPDIESQFYILLEKKDSNGNILLSRKLGTPDLRRKGISSYRIDRIFTDKSGKSFVIIIEKTQLDETGTSIRYMVETVRF